MPMSPRLLRPRASGLVLPSDADARAYVLAVNSADQQPLEPLVVQAIDAFVIGCKADGIWSAIKASCILMGARTLAGALTPLVGTAPTNNGPFVSGDYNRETGLLGDGVGKYLDSNRNVNADPQDSFHQSVYVTTAMTGVTAYIGAGAAASGASQFSYAVSSGGTITWRNRQSASVLQTSTSLPTGLIAASRGASNVWTSRINNTSTSRAQQAQAPFNGNSLVFARNDASNVAGLFSDARMAFYSIGESLDLDLLDTRITTLYNAIGAAIP